MEQMEKEGVRVIHLDDSDREYNSDDEIGHHDEDTG